MQQMTLADNGNSAILSPCGLYRYRLERHIGEGKKTAAVIMVNPSTADAEQDDATIRKLKEFCRRLDMGRLIVGNLFAYRATDVRELRVVAAPCGPDSNKHLEAMLYEADLCIVGWGALSKLPTVLHWRWRDVVRTAKHLGVTLHCWGVCSDGHPRHPLMLAYSTPLEVWVPPC